MNLDHIVLAGGGPIFEAVWEGWPVDFNEPEILIRRDERITVGRTQGADLLLCIGHPQILTRAILDTTYCINLHSSLLPRHRGRHPVNWAMIQGDRKIGLTLHEMDEGIDTGDILLQWAMAMEPAQETYTEVTAKLAGIAPGIVKFGLMKLRDGSIVPTPQVGFGDTDPRRTPEDSRIDWSKTPEEIAWFINGQHPDAPAFDDERVYRRAWFELHTANEPRSPSSPSTASTPKSKPTSSPRSTVAGRRARSSLVRKSSGSKRR